VGWIPFCHQPPRWQIGKSPSSALSRWQGEVGRFSGIADERLQVVRPGEVVGPPTGVASRPHWASLARRDKPSRGAFKQAAFRLAPMDFYTLIEVVVAVVIAAIIVWIVVPRWARW
jgi:hypothetical protein